MKIEFELNKSDRMVANTAFTDHIHDSSKAGSEALGRGINVPVRGWDSSQVRKLLQITFDLDEKSIKRFVQEIVMPLQDVVHEINKGADKVDVSFAGFEDLPPHATYWRADFRKSPEGVLESTHEALKRDLYFQGLLSMLQGQEVTVDAAVIGPNSYGCTRTPSGLMVAGRRLATDRLNKVVTAESGVSVPQYNLLHFVAARVLNASPEAGEYFAIEGSKAVQKNVGKSSFDVRVGNGLFIPASEHIGMHRPQLLIAA